MFSALEESICSPVLGNKGCTSGTTAIAYLFDPILLPALAMAAILIYCVVFEPPTGSSLATLITALGGINTCGLGYLLVVLIRAFTGSATTVQEPWSALFALIAMLVMLTLAAPFTRLSTATSKEYASGIALLASGHFLVTAFLTMIRGEFKIMGMLGNLLVHMIAICVYFVGTYLYSHVSKTMLEKREAKGLEVE